MPMKYFLLYLILCVLNVTAQEGRAKAWRLGAHADIRKTLKEAQLSEKAKKEIEDQFIAIAQALNKDLLAYSKPEQIQELLEQWQNLKTEQLNMPIDDIRRIVVTARTAQKLAKVTAVTQAQVAAHMPPRDSALQSSTKVKFANGKADTEENNLIQLNYINAQLSYEKICNHLGIPK